jgi:hypothetical protein
MKFGFSIKINGIWQLIFWNVVINMYIQSFIHDSDRLFVGATCLMCLSGMIQQIRHNRKRRKREYDGS